jgi:hypothetical protein
METSASAPAPRKWQRITGWVISCLIAAFLFLGASMALRKAPEAVEPTTHKFGYPEDLMVPLGVVELILAILFLIPRTSILGGLLLTAYLGGAVATHVRVHDNFAMAVIFGVLVWIALYLREPRVRTLLPLTSS